MKAILLLALALLGLGSASAFHVTEDYAITATDVSLNDAGFSGKGVQEQFGRYMWTSLDGEWLVVAHSVVVKDAWATTTELESGGFNYFQFDQATYDQGNQPWVSRGTIAPRLASADSNVGTNNEQTPDPSVNDVYTKFKWERTAANGNRCARFDVDANGFGATADHTFTDGVPVTATALAAQTAPVQTTWWEYTQDAGSGNANAVKTMTTGCFDWLTSFAINEDGSVLVYGYTGSDQVATVRQPYDGSPVERVAVNAGIAYVYERESLSTGGLSQTFTYKATITSSVPTPNGNCGASVSAYGKRVMVGCPGDDVHAITDSANQNPDNTLVQAIPGDNTQVEAASPAVTVTTVTSAGGAVGDSIEDRSKVYAVGAVEVWFRAATSTGTLSTTWTREQRLIEDVAARTNGRNFGNLVLASSNVLLVQKPGSTGFYAYMHDGATPSSLARADGTTTGGGWTMVQELYPKFAPPTTSSLDDQSVVFSDTFLAVRNGANFVVYTKMTNMDMCVSPTGFWMPAGNQCENEYMCEEANTLAALPDTVANPSSFAMNLDMIAIGVPGADYDYREMTRNHVKDLFIASQYTTAQGSVLAGERIRNAGLVHYWERRTNLNSVNMMDTTLLDVAGNAYQNTPFIRNLRVRNTADSYFVYGGRIQPARMYWEAQCGASVAVAKGHVLAGCPANLNTNLNDATAPGSAIHAFDGADALSEIPTNSATNGVMYRRPVLTSGTGTAANDATTTLGATDNDNEQLNPYTFNPYHSAAFDDYVVQNSLYMSSLQVDPDGYVILMDMNKLEQNIKDDQSQLVDSPDLLFGDETGINFAGGCLANDGDMLLVGAPGAARSGVAGAGAGVLMNGASGEIMGKLCSKMPMAGVAMGTQPCAIKGNYRAMVIDITNVERTNQNGDTDALNVQNDVDGFGALVDGDPNTAGVQPRAAGGAVEVFEGTTHVARVFPNAPNANMRFGVASVSFMEVTSTTATDVLLLVSADSDDLVADENGARHKAQAAYKQNAGSIQIFRRTVATDGTITYPYVSSVTASDTYGLVNQYNTVGGKAQADTSNANGNTVAAAWGTWGAQYTRAQQFSNQGFSVSGSLLAVPDQYAAQSSNLNFYDYTKRPGCNCQDDQGHFRNPTTTRRCATNHQTCGEVLHGAVYVYSCTASGCTEAQRVTPPSMYTTFDQAGGTDYTFRQMQINSRSASNPYGSFGSFAFTSTSTADSTSALGTDTNTNAAAVTMYTKNADVYLDNNARFGYQSALCDNGDLVVSGRYPAFYGEDTGVLFYYSKSTTANTWTYSANITAYDSSAGNRLGSTELACTGGFVHAVGNNGKGFSSHYVFQVDTSVAGAPTWKQVARFDDNPTGLLPGDQAVVNGRTTYFRAPNWQKQEFHDSGTGMPLNMFLDRLNTGSNMDDIFEGGDADPYLCRNCRNGQTTNYGAIARVDFNFDGAGWSDPGTTNWPQGRGAGITGIVIGSIIGAFLVGSTIYLLITVQGLSAAKGPAV
ncbi:unnamed protein product [Pedinophyceae sp. YPF-701]|nr:unnamed protein product [Pedinophyceae sp. YPF-701]